MYTLDESLLDDFDFYTEDMIDAIKEQQAGIYYVEVYKL